MALKRAVLAGETSPLRKLVAKAIPIIAGDSDRGEQHEIKTIFEAIDGRLALSNSKTCLLPSPNGHEFFSRSGWEPRKLGEVTVSSLKRVLVIEKNSNVSADGHEVDLVLEHAPGGDNMVLVECKAGDARSKGSQLNAHLEHLLSTSRPGKTSHFLALCEEGALPAGPVDYYPFFHRVFRAIAGIGTVIGTPGPAIRARSYFSQFKMNRTGQPLLDLNNILDTAVRSHDIVANPDNEILKIGVLNELLYSKAAIRLQIFHVKRASRTAIATMTRKAAQEILRTAPSAEDTFWTSLIEWLKESEKG